MADFDRYKNNCSRIDWEIFMNGSVSLYYSYDVLEKDLKWLLEKKYKIVRIDLKEINTQELFHKRIKESCHFPEYYGENMSALSDCLRHDLEIPFKSGAALVLENFNLFYEKDKSAANEILERLSRGSRERILTGERLITLIHTNDPQFDPEEIGSFKIRWNRCEFMDERRLGIQ